MTKRLDEIKKNEKRLPVPREDKNIALIGFMGSGKSTVAECLKELYQMDVVEMDEEIVRREGMSIPEIFNAYGEPYFRDLETKLLTELNGRKHTVISCGGGVALREENVSEIKKSGSVVLLAARPETIFQRVKNDRNRPLLSGNMTMEYIASMMEKRREKYEAAADITVYTDGKDGKTICGEIIRKLNALEE